MTETLCTGELLLKRSHPFQVDRNSLQLRILQRGMTLLKPGGRLVYSTCSLNPAEDESVIAAALHAFPDFHLVDVSEDHLRLKRRKGKSSWKVATKPPGESSMSWHDTYDDYVKSYELGQERQKPGDKLKPLPRSLWPPTPEDVEKLHLDRWYVDCGVGQSEADMYSMRLLPHDQDTGGFFVAVLQKSGNPSAPDESDQPTESSSAQAADVPEPTDESEAVEASEATPLVADEAGTSTVQLTNGKHSRSPSSSTPAAEPEAKRAKEEAAAAPERKPRRDPGFREDPYSYADVNHDEVKSVQ